MELFAFLQKNPVSAFTCSRLDLGGFTWIFIVLSAATAAAAFVVTFFAFIVTFLIIYLTAEEQKLNPY